MWRPPWFGDLVSSSRLQWGRDLNLRYWCYHHHPCPHGWCQVQWLVVTQNGSIPLEEIPVKEAQFKWASRHHHRLPDASSTFKIQIFMFWLRYKFGALEVTKRVGEDWGWVVQLEVGIGNQDHPGWRSLWWWSEGGGNITIAICNSSGGLPKAGDHHHLIGKEQSRLKGEHGTSTIHCQKLMGNHLASHMSRGLWHFPGLIFFFCLKPPAPYKLHFQ